MKCSSTSAYGETFTFECSYHWGEEAQGGDNDEVLQWREGFAVQERVTLDWGRRTCSKYVGNCRGTFQLTWWFQVLTRAALQWCHCIHRYPVMLLASMPPQYYPSEKQSREKTFLLIISGFRVCIIKPFTHQRASMWLWRKMNWPNYWEKNSAPASM